MQHLSFLAHFKVVLARERLLQKINVVTDFGHSEKLTILFVEVLDKTYLRTIFRFSSPPSTKLLKFVGISEFHAFKSTRSFPSPISKPSFWSPSLVNCTKRMISQAVFINWETVYILTPRWKLWHLNLSLSVWQWICHYLYKFTCMRGILTDPFCKNNW